VAMDLFIYSPNLVNDGVFLDLVIVDIPLLEKGISIN
jgi:hypothetical protein